MPIAAKRLTDGCDNFAYGRVLAADRVRERTVQVLLEQLRESSWLAWWSPAPDDVLEITYESSSMVNAARITARRGANKLRIRIERPRADILAATDQVALARDDVEAMLNTAEPDWLRQSLHAELDEAKTGDTIAALRSHLAHLAIAMTDEERTTLAELTTTQR